MTIPLWCLLGGLVLPYVWTGVASYLRKEELGSLDNKHPRLQHPLQKGVGARANGAQANSWEALTLFAPCVIVAHLGAPNSSTATILEKRGYFI